VWDAAIEARAKQCATAAIDAASDWDKVDECSIPRLAKQFDTFF